MVENAIHAVVASVLVPILVYPKARTSPRTTALALVMPRQGISARKFTATLRACVRPLASVEFGMALQIVQSTETRLASWAFVRFLLAVGEKMAFKVVMASEIRSAVGALVAFGVWRSRAVVLAVPSHGHAEHTGGLPRIMFRGCRDRESLRSSVGESSLAGLGARMSSGL